MKHITSQEQIKPKTLVAKSKKKDQSIVHLMKRNVERMNKKGSTLPQDNNNNNNNFISPQG